MNYIMIIKNDIWGKCNQNVSSRSDAYTHSDISFLILSTAKDSSNILFQIETMLIKDRGGSFLPGQNISFSNGSLQDFMQKYKLIYRDNQLKIPSLTTLLPVNKNGLFCKICKELYPYAESNQIDGSLICYSCRA